MTVPVGNWVAGVYFTEAPHIAERLEAQPIRVEISRQNSNLRAVKERLASQVLTRGGNALVMFEYGQRSHSILQQLFSFRWDTESWHGSGFVARVPLTEPRRSTDS